MGSTLGDEAGIDNERMRMATIMGSTMGGRGLAQCWEGDDGHDDGRLGWDWRWEDEESTLGD